MGEYITAVIHRNKVKTQFFYRGIKDFFPEHAGRDELIAENNLDSLSIVSFIEKKVI